ncbi:MAG: hypothetical protein ACLR8Y_04565 [Alistipes indistinctus]
MLNHSFIWLIVSAFAVATPAAYIILATMAPEFRLQNEPRLVDFRRCRDNRPAPVRDRRLVAKLARGNRQSGECDPERINPGGSVNGPQHPGGNTDSPYDIRDILKVVLQTSPL